MSLALWRELDCDFYGSRRSQTEEFLDHLHQSCLSPNNLLKWREGGESMFTQVFGWLKSLASKSLKRLSKFIKDLT